MIIFLYGEDTFRSRQKLNELKEKFLREIDPAGYSLTVLESDKITMEKINQAIGSISLLSKKRMIVIENIFNKKEELFFEQLLGYFKNKKEAQDDNIIIFWDDVKSGEKGITKTKLQFFNYLAKQKFAQEFKALTNLEILNWTKIQIEKRGGQISKEALSLLIALTGADSWQLNQEIDKLINFKSGQKLNLGDEHSVAGIEVADVHENVQGIFDDKIFALTDAISNRNRASAVKLFEDQLEMGKSEDYLLNMIIRQIKILLQVRQALDSGFNSKKLTSVLKLHPFVAQKCISQVRNFSLLSLRNFLSNLVKIDYLMKNGRTDVKTALNLLMAKL